MAYRVPTRADDERLLSYLRARARGDAWAEIGRRHGRRQELVRTEVVRVLEADARETPEAPPLLQAGAVHG